jgi:hypothetical protein
VTTRHSFDRSAAARFVTIALLLGIAAVYAPTPFSSDRQVYDSIGPHPMLDCGDIHCFRILVAMALERLPGPSLLKWKTYAVLTNAAAAIAVGRLCLVMGFSSRTARFSTWIAGLGYGPLQAVFDPYTSDPVMYLLGPLMTAGLLRERLVLPGALGSIGVLAKEFAAAPLWIAALWAALRRRWDFAVRAALLALTATLVWLTLQTVLMTLYNYGYGGNPSVDLLGGGYLAVWASALGPARTAASLFMVYGAVYVLFVPGLARSDQSLKLFALACVPAAAAFVYVQQPDRALWNFHFIVIPLSVSLLTALPDWACWTFVVSFAAANLRLGTPQPPALATIRIAMLAISIAIAVSALLPPRLRPASLPQ